MKHALYDFLEQNVILTFCDLTLTLNSADNLAFCLCMMLLIPLGTLRVIMVAIQVFEWKA